ncbi:OB-fold domain-containing protein [Myxococcota bacterium]|nr:OB-fold domain-containing protein [Myxococcota bacterium]
MSLLSELASLHPDSLSSPFWDACKKRELRLQRCADCGAFRHPPLAGCPSCASTRDEWALVGGRGRVYSHTTIYHPALPTVADEVPYNVVVVEFDDAPGARIISNVLDAEPEEIHVGLELELHWDDCGDGVVLPRFKIAQK